MNYAGECFNDAKICNGFPDLWYGEDEENCVDWNCTQGRWKCGTGMCISTDHVCDGDYDCKHFDDTDEANCESWTCPIGRWKCSDGVQCIPDYFVCNYHPDCQDSSDEENCENWICEASLWQCSDGGCISNYLVCNKELDCWDNSDELCMSVIDRHLSNY